MRSALHNLLVVAISLALFVAASRLLRRAPTDGYVEAERVVVTPDANLKRSVLDAATIERLRQWRFKPGTTSYVMPIQVVPPPTDHESVLRIKATS